MSRGRQTKDGAAVRRVQVMLDDATIERAKGLGDGNVSQGIRQATKAPRIGAIHIKRLRRLLDDWKHEDQELCEKAGDVIVPRSMRARKIKDAESLAAMLDLLDA